MVSYRPSTSFASLIQWLPPAGPKDTVDHHDGTQAVDLDGDGDLDIISIGWYNPKVWIYENKSQP